MTEPAHRSTRFLLLFVLIAGLIPRSAHADDIGQQKPVRLNATETYGPIGAIYSPGTAGINGRSVQGKQAIWGGDLIETFKGAKASVLLDAVGQMTLGNDAKVRLSTKLAALDDNGSGPVLVASLIRGDIVVRLNQEANAYIEAGGSAYTSSSGASFRIEIREGKAVIREANGSVTIDLQHNRSRIEPRAVNIKGEEISIVPLKARVKKRSSEIGIFFKKLIERQKTRAVSYNPGAQLTNDQTTQTELVTNRLVHFRVEPPNIGQIVNAAGQVITSERTDSRGIVTVYFQAGDNPATGQIIANVELSPEDIADGTTAIEYRQDVIIMPGGVSLRTKILVTAGAAGLGGILWCCVIHKDPQHVPVQNPPPVIIP